MNGLVIGIFKIFLVDILWKSCTHWKVYCKWSGMISLCRKRLKSYAFMPFKMHLGAGSDREQIPRSRSATSGVFVNYNWYCPNNSHNDLLSKMRRLTDLPIIPVNFFFLFWLRKYLTLGIIVHIWWIDFEIPVENILRYFVMQVKWTLEQEGSVIIVR